MKEITYIQKNDAIKLSFKGFMEVNKAVTRARESGINGKIEVHHIIIKNKENFTYTVYYISEENKINGAVFPYKLGA